MVEIADVFKAAMALGMLTLGGLVNWWFNQLSKRNERALQTQEETRRALEQLVLKVERVEHKQLSKADVNEIVDAKIGGLREQIMAVSKSLDGTKAIGEKVHELDNAVAKLSARLDNFAQNQHG